MEQRLGGRRPVIWLQLSWVVERPTRWKKHQVEERLSAIDVSVTGIGAVARTAPNVTVGSTVDLQLNEHRVKAVVRRIVADDVSEDESYYGLQFIRPSPDFIEALFLQAGAEPREHAEELWSRAN